MVFAFVTPHTGCYNRPWLTRDPQEASVTRANRWLVSLISHHEPLLLLGILLVALALRLYDVNWDEGHHTHPDERWITIVATTIHWPHDLSRTFDPHATTWNPLFNYEESQAAGEYRMRHFAYGHLPLYLLTVTAWILHNLAPLAEKMGASAEVVRWLAMANTYDGFPQVGRHLSALFDAGTVLLVYAIGRRVYGARVGLLAAALSALTVTQIQLAHFYAFDPVAAFFIVLALFGAVRLAQGGDWGSAMWTGIAAGCAVSSKFSAIPILAVLGIGAFIPVWQALRARHTSSAPTRGDPAIADGVVITGSLQVVGSSQVAGHISRGLMLALSALVWAFIAFAVTSPFAVLDWDAYRTAVIEEQGAMVRGEADFPYTRQYRGTTPFLYQIEQQIRWGMGWPLGIMAFLGLGWVLARAMAGRARPEEWVILAWVVPYFGVTGLFMVKFMRYMLPLVPLFTLMGTAMINAWWEASRQAGKSASQPRCPWPFVCRLSSLIRRLGWLSPWMMAVVLIGTATWALAFVNGVYGGTHPWIQASRWFYENAPDGSVILWEYWDDPLPLSLPEPNANMAAHGFQQIAWGPFEEDTPQKFELMKSVLRQADFISIASNRIYRAVPRLPQRYPMTIRYYQLLFEGKLGFEKVAEFTSYPRLGSLVLVDDDADESFTLYDHPKPIIFRKVRDLSDAEWDALLGGSWQGAIPYYTGSRQDQERVSASVKGERRKSLLLDRPVDELPVVNDFRWNRVANRWHGLAVITWWGALTLIGLLAWPLTFTAFVHLRDRGYAFSRGLGWLVVGWIGWILASLRLLPNTLPTLLLALTLLGVLSLVLWRRRRAEMRSFWQAQWLLVLAHEVIFGLAFLFFVFIRLLNPDLWQPWNGGEKFMEFAFLNAILRSAYFPPYDPYYAGGYINYYYYGQYLVALLIKLTGIAPSVAFNLAVPTLFALTVSGAFGLVYSLAPVSHLRRTYFWARGLGWGLVGSALVTLIGNLDGMGQVMRKLGQIGGSSFESAIPGLQTLVRAAWGVQAVLFRGARLPDFNYWDPSRVIPFTINEFPLWSFLFADLHPHMIGIPFTILFLGLAYNLVASYGSPWMAEGRWEGILAFLVLPLTLGALGVINTWDLPTYLGVGLLAFLLREWRGHGLRRSEPALVRPIRLHLFLPYAVVLIGLALGLYLPFYRSYAVVGSSGVGLVRHPTTLVSQWLMIWGFFIFIGVSFVFSELRQRLPRGGGRGHSCGLVRWARLWLEWWDRPARLLELHALLVRTPTVGYVLTRWAFGLGVLVGIGALLLNYRVVAMLWLPLLAAVLLLFRDTASPEDLFIGALVFTGLLVLTGVEVFFLKDFLCGCPPGSNMVGDYYRMNTLFKFYIQAWVLLGAGGAAALARLWPRVMDRWPSHWRTAWSGVFAVLLASSLVFPLLGVPARVNDRFPGARPSRNTLDGMAYMTVGVYAWPDGNHLIELRYDYEAIQWMLDHIQGTPVVAEAPASWYLVGDQSVGYDYYRAGGLRVASLTGFPGLLGQHQGEQRYGDQVGPRERDGVEFFQTTDLARARALMEQLRISYIYIGKLERILFSPESLAKFDQMVAEGQLEVVFQNEQVKLYRVIRLSS
jgi:YYY domain-containing protein